MAPKKKAVTAKAKTHKRSGGFWTDVGYFWHGALDFALVIWVLRVPVFFTAFGFLILLLVPQAQDLLVNTADNITDGNAGALIAFVALLVAVWAAPMHYVSRLLLDTDLRLGKHAKTLRGGRASFLKGVERCMPRLLGLCAFVAMFFACIRANSNLPDLSRIGVDAGPIQRNLYLIMAALVVLAAVFFIYTLKRDDIAKSRFAAFIERAANRLLLLLHIEGLAHWLPSRAKIRARNSGPIFLILISLAFCVLPLFFPAYAAKLIPLALFIPFVIGGWLPILSLLSGIGRRLRVPFITIVLAILWLGPAFLGEGYDVRQIETTARIQKLKQDKSVPEPDLLRSMPLSEALDLWMRANRCANDAAACPRPILIVGSGGASRAGFFTASTIGALLDSRYYKHDAQSTPHGLTPQEIQKRIFAFSTVSGSSVGAVMTVSAMAAADGSMSQPCRAKSYAQYWHGFPQKDREITSWRDCLEALMSADYLTPTFSGFMFRDVFRIFSFLGGLRDRATLLEESWERHFEDMIANPKNEGALACAGSLECPFRSLRPTRTRWLPLLVLNGTSVTTGQRIVTSVLEWPARNDPPQEQNPKQSRGICGKPEREYPCAMFQSTFLFHWLANARPFEKDIAISTAALNSARFPLISPPGEIYNCAKDGEGCPKRKMQDRVVDGGYFENYGALTALELVTAIQALRPGLAPFILTLTNDPEIPLGFDASHAPGTENALAIDVIGPVDAIVNARSAAGYITLVGIETAMRPNMSKTCAPNSAYLRVFPQLRIKTQKGMTQKSNPGVDDIEVGERRALSMSWWLSRPVQRYLNKQVPLNSNGCGNNLFCIENQAEIKAFMTHALIKPDGCSGTPSGNSIAIMVETILRISDSVQKSFGPRQSDGITKKN
ncbi:MAG: hypothetical protein KF835_12200 [Xanthobacteraceae bacterium]|nr:hypothetical protein [Xanthobacteraceae bacterium]